MGVCQAPDDAFYNRSRGKGHIEGSRVGPVFLTVFVTYFSVRRMATVNLRPFNVAIGLHPLAAVSPFFSLVTAPAPNILEISKAQGP